MTPGQAGPATVRRLAPADAERYRAIRLGTLEAEPDFFGSDLATEAGRPLAEFAARIASAAVFGAYAGDALVGVIDFRREPRAKEAHKGHVRGFHVRPEWRRRGVGTALLAAMIHAARDEVEQLTLGVVAENRDAIALYERFGFATYGVEPRARRTARGMVGMVLMVLFLHPHAGMGASGGVTAPPGSPSP